MMAFLANYPVGNNRKRTILPQSAEKQQTALMNWEWNGFQPPLNSVFKSTLLVHKQCIKCDLLQLASEVNLFTTPSNVKTSNFSSSDPITSYLVKANTVVVLAVVVNLV